MVEEDDDDDVHTYLVSDVLPDDPGHLDGWANTGVG